MESLDVVKFGIFDDFSHVFGTGVITNVVSLNHREMIISTTKEIIKIERNFIKMRHPLKFSTIAIVPGTDFLIGVTIQKGDLVIYEINDLPQKQQSYNSQSVDLPPPIHDNFPTNQSGIFHMIYSPKSQAIITIGSGIKVFTLQYKLSRISVIKPSISISNRSSFASDYATTILVPPAFDSESELLLLPASEGIVAYNLDGTPVMQCTKFPASLSTVYAMHQSKQPQTFNNKRLTDTPANGKKPVSLTKKLLTYDSDKGMAIWGKKGQLIEQFNTIGSSVLAIMFVDSENALCYNSNHALFYLNIKTGKTFFCLNLEKNPTRLFLVYINKEPYLCACFSSFMRVLKVVIPWTVWNLNIEKTVSIKRCNKFKSAARVLIEAENSFIKLYSPRDGSKMTVATPSEAVHPVSYFYDRGIVERYLFDKDRLKYNIAVTKISSGVEKAGKEKKSEVEEEEDKNENSGRDILFIILEDGTIIGFDANVSNCEEVMKMKCKAAFMAICRIKASSAGNKKHGNENENENEIKDQWCYVIASEKSDLFILDYFSMKEIRHFTVTDDKLIKMFYNFDSECVVMVFERKSILFDIEKGKIIDTVMVGGNQMTTMFANFLIFGYETGHIRRVSIENKSFVLCNDNKKKNENDNDENVIKNNAALQKPHSGPITGFSFSQKIWISSGLDGNVIVWDYNFEKVFKFSLPLPLKACLVMNGKRDILVATDTEVMQIKDNYLIDYFENDPYDIEIDEIDNFDKIRDALCHETVEPFDPDAYENLSMSDVLSDNYSDDEDEKKKANSKKKFNFSSTPKRTIKTFANSETPKKIVDEKPVEKIKKPEATEDSKENVQKKFEMMQAMNGIGPAVTIPSSTSAPANHPSSSAKADNDQPAQQDDESKNNEKEEKDNKKVEEPKKKKPPKDGKALSDFINSNMEQEKAQNKKKKVKKVNNNPEPEKVKDEEPKKSEAEIKNMIGNLFDRNKPKDVTSHQNKKKTSGEGIDFNELAKKFHKDEEPLVVNLDKADLSRKAKNKKDDDDDDEYEDDEGQEDGVQSNKPTSSNKAKTKPSTASTSNPTASSKAKPATNSSSKPKPTNANESSSSKAKPSNANESTSSKSKSNSNSNAKSKPKENAAKSNQGANDAEKKENRNNSKNPSKAKDSTNEGKANNSPKKSKNSSSPGKTGSKSNTNPDKTNNSASNNKISSDPSKSMNFGTDNNNNLGNNNNKNGINNNNNNNSSGINNNKTNPISQESGSKGGKVSIGTQGDNFDSNNGKDNEPANQENEDDSMHLEIKMNGTNPIAESTDFADSSKENENKGKEDNSQLSTNNNENIAQEEADNDSSANQGKKNELQNALHNSENDESIADANDRNEVADNKNANDRNKLADNKNANDRNKLADNKNVNDRNKVADNKNANEKPKRTLSVDDEPKNKRSPTPPPIRPQISNKAERTPRLKERRRPRTPPLKRQKPPVEFRMPPPNIVIDQEAVLVLYGRGRLEFKPLVDRIQREMMMGCGIGPFYTQNQRITLAFVQNYGNPLMGVEGKPMSKQNKSFSQTQQPIVPPIQIPPNSMRAQASPFIDDEDANLFSGSVNSISPAYNFASSMKTPKSRRPKSSRKVIIDKDSRINDIQRPFTPSAYVYNYDNNTETIINSLDTCSGVTTPRNILSSDVENAADETEENANNEDPNSDEKSFQRSPRRIQSARTVRKPISSISKANGEYQVNMPYPLTPIVMASPRRSINKKKPLLADKAKEDEANQEEKAVSVDKLESAVMTKVPNLHIRPSSPSMDHSPDLHKYPNLAQFGASKRPNSVRTFERSPLKFNQPIGIAMVKPGMIKKRNSAFYASVAVTSSISNARRSSPPYSSAKSNRNLNKNNYRNGHIGPNDLSNTSPNEIEITVK